MGTANSQIKLPNGVTSCLETHFVIVECITLNLEKSEVCKEIQEQEGHPGLYALALELTLEFEKRHKGREWDGEWLEVLWEFCDKKLGL